MKKISHPSFSLDPPLGFAFVEEKLCRACGPLQYSMYSMLDMINVGCVLNLSEEKLDSNTKMFLIESNISLYELFPNSSSSAIETSWVVNTLNLLLSLPFSSPVLLLGSKKSYLDCVLIACLRKLQGICISNIVSEFRGFSGPFRHFDLEQFVEHFDPLLLEVPDSISLEFLDLHFQLLNEENKLLDRIKDDSFTAKAERGVSENLDWEQTYNDYLVKRLCFSDSQIVISPGLLDSVISSQVHDKEDDD